MKKRNGTAESPQQLVSHLRGLLSEAEELVGHSAGEFVGEKAEAMRERLHAAQERLHELYDTAQERVVAGAKTADKTIRAHPYESLAVAIGVGVLLGALLRRNN
jgi:ElaB/YqjD/DUF883 family membrane-anchored ribosome-binding protein